MASAASVSGAPARRPACSSASMQAVDFMPLGPIADAELNAEIDAEADEQHGEVDRYQVERADHDNMPSAAVTERPTMRLTNTAKMIRNQRSAIHRMNSTTAMVMRRVERRRSP